MCLFGDVTGVLFWRRDPSPKRRYDGEGKGGNMLGKGVNTKFAGITVAKKLEKESIFFDF